jgi:hypothetical protein
MTLDLPAAFAGQTHQNRGGGERPLSGGARDSRAVSGDPPQTPDARVFLSGVQNGWSFEPQRRKEEVLRHAEEHKEIPLRSSPFSSAPLRLKNAADLRDASRHVVFPASRRKQHASRVLHPRAALGRLRDFAA